MNVQAEYYRLYSKLKEGIESGVYAPGTKLPSERALMEQERISRTTIRSALELLENDGYVVKRPGFGCIVNLRTSEDDSRKLRIGIVLNIHNSRYQSGLFRHIQNVSCPGFSVEYLVMSKSSVLEDKCDVDGIILSSFGSDEILRLEREYHHDKPLLFLNRYSLREDFAYLAVNYNDFSRRIVSRLLKNGVRRIAVVGCGESEDLGYAEYTRTQGWKKAYEDETGSYPKELMFSKNVALNMSEYTEFLRNDRPEVVYVLTGGELPVAWAGLVQAGLTPGKDVEVVCFDDVEEFGLHFHPVSFVRMPLVLMASKAVDYFAHRDKMEVLKEFVEPQLIVENCKYLL